MTLARQQDPVKDPDSSVVSREQDLFVRVLDGSL